MSTFTPNETQLQNYIQNKLSDSEVEKVELWLADHPEVLEDMEMGVMFKQGLKNQTYIQNSKSSFFGVFDIFTSRKWIPIHLLVYGLVGFFIFNVIDSNNVAPQNESNFQIISLSHLRGGDSKHFNPIARIKLNINESSHLVLVVQLEFPEEDVYSVQIVKYNTSEKIITINNLKPLGVGDLNISIPTNILYRGKFVLNVTKGGNQIAELPFEIL
jgi:hypothetical protein